MNKLAERKLLLLPWVTVILIVALFGVTGASAKSSTVDSAQSTGGNKVGSPLFIGSQAAQTSRLTPFGTRSARIAQSSQYLAVAYQHSGTIRLRSTKKEGDGAWIPFPPVLGSGAAPSLIFSDDITVHVVWVDSDQRLIYYVSCSLTVGKASCGTPAPINTNTGQTVESPEITFLAGTLYVAWINSSASQVIVARSNTNGSSWQFNTTPLSASSSSGGTVALAASGSFIHLAYSYNNSSNIKYYHSTDGNSWDNNGDFGPDLNYLQVSNPTIEASGLNVYLAWDSLHNATDFEDNFKKYGLLGILSTDGGVSWKDSNAPRYIDSSNLSGTGGLPTDRRRTRNVSGAQPQEEAGLRPSVALTQQNRFAIVWQERPNATCVADESGTVITSNGTSEVYYAAEANPSSSDTSGWWATKTTVETPSINFYSIDPDLVIDSSGDQHFIFMKASAPTGEVNCQAGGGPTEYAIYYRGPYYTTIEPDKVLLPVIVK